MDAPGDVVDLTDEVEAAPSAGPEAGYDADALLREDAELTTWRAQERAARETVATCVQALSEARSELRRAERGACARVKALVDAAERRIDWVGRAFPWDAALLAALRDVFRISSFRPLQREAVNAVLSGRDVLAIMPTGHGKSLLYQLAAVVQRGLTVVVSPLIALINDQREALRRLGVAAYCLEAGSAKEEVAAVFADVLPTTRKGAEASRPVREGKPWTRSEFEAQVLFVTPERIAKSKKLMSRLQLAYAEGRLTRFTIDEAHCVSSWGHDFRHDYTQLGVLKRMFPKASTLCLTATASEEVQKDVCESLDMRPVVFRGGVDRPNLFYEVRRKTESVVDEIAATLNGDFSGQAGIIYVLSRKDTEAVARQLRDVHGIKAGFYHGDMESSRRATTYKKWCSGAIQVVVATIAFGLGIDKQDCRFVIHIDFASSLEGYYQESGRAGRDGKPARCIVYFRVGDVLRMSAFVADKGRKRLPMVYESARYCLALSDLRRPRVTIEKDVNCRSRKRLKAENSCRRAMLAAVFLESAPARASDRGMSSSEKAGALREGIGLASACCDLCADSQDRAPCRVKVDVSEQAGALVRILDSYMSRNPEENVTVTRLASEWGNHGKKGAAFRGPEPPLPRVFDKDVRVEIVVMCIIEGVLQEYHTYGMYSMLGYVKVGNSASKLSGGSLRVFLDVEPGHPILSRKTKA